VIFLKVERAQGIEPSCPLRMANSLNQFVIGDDINTGVRREPVDMPDGTVTVAGKAKGPVSRFVVGGRTFTEDLP
jgi:hypothetical protein